MSDSRGIRSLHVLGSLCSILGVLLALEWFGTGLDFVKPSRTADSTFSDSAPPDSLPDSLPPLFDEVPVAPGPGIVKPLVQERSVESQSSAPSREPSPVPPPTARDAELDFFLRNVTPTRRSGVAAAVHGTPAGDAADLVLAGIGDLGVPLLHGVFHRGFLSTPQFDQLNGGDGRLLHRAGVLGPGALALVGSVRHTFQKGEYGLITCDLSFSYTVFDADGSARSTRTFAVRIPAYDERTALRDAVDALLSNHAAAIQADLH